MGVEIKRKREKRKIGGDEEFSVAECSKIHSH